MLNAILHGKAGTLPVGVGEGASLRALFKASEDLLTATVFERLAYLSGADVWAVLAHAAQPKILLPRRVVELRSIAFWPRYARDADMPAGVVEPDAVLRFSVGDPAEAWTLIVESKLGAKQTPGQWAAQWRAVVDAEPDVERGKLALLAIGGIAGARLATVERFVAAARAETGLEIQAAAAGWGDLLDGVLALDLCDPARQRVRHDLIEALALFGFRRIAEMKDLPLYRPGRSFDAARARRALGPL